MSTYQDLMKRRLDLSKAARSLRSVKAHTSAKSEITSETAVKAALLASVVAAADLVPGKGSAKPTKSSMLDSPDKDSLVSKKLLNTVVGSKLGQKGEKAKQKFPDLDKDHKLQSMLNKKRGKLNDAANKKSGDKRLEDQFAKLAKTGVDMADNALAVLGKMTPGKQDVLFAKVVSKQLLLLGRLDRLLGQVIVAARAS